MSEHLVAQLERVAALVRRRDQVARQLESLRYEFDGLDRQLADAHSDELAWLFPEPPAVDAPEALHHRVQVVVQAQGVPAKEGEGPVRGGHKI